VISRERIAQTIRRSLLEQWATDTHSDAEKAEGAKRFWISRAEAATDEVMLVLLEEDMNDQGGAPCS
jgi:hypothetical protein